MQTQGSMTTRWRGSWSGIFGKFAWLAFFLWSTSLPSFAGFQGQDARESSGGLVRPTLRTGSGVPRDNQVSRSTSGGGYRIGFMSNFRSGNAPAIINQERPGSQDSFVPSVPGKIAGTTGNRRRRQEILIHPALCHLLPGPRRGLNSILRKSMIRPKGDHKHPPFVQPRLAQRSTMTSSGTNRRSLLSHGNSKSAEIDLSGHVFSWAI